MSLLSQREIADYLSVVDKVPEKQREKIRQLLEMDRVQRCQESFLSQDLELADRKAVEAQTWLIEVRWALKVKREWEDQKQR